jgi:TFIIF-interacting CTD phosphatase-like protein
MPYKNTNLKVYSVQRFGLESFLFEMSKIFEIVVYTTNIKDYADHVL